MSLLYKDATRYHRAHDPCPFRSLLVWCVLKQRGKVIAVSLLLDKGADVESRTATDGTPLVWGCMGGDPKVVQLLLKRGADINACTTVREALQMSLHDDDNDDDEMILTI